MDAHQLGMIGAGIVGGGRALTGIFFLAAPAKGARRWVGDSSLPARYLARAVGARDLVIGAGVLWAMVADDPIVPWVVASVVGDVSDAVTGAAMLEGTERRDAMALAGGFGVLGAATVALLLA